MYASVYSVAAAATIARAYLTRDMLARGHVDDTFSLIQPQDLVQDDSTLIVRTPQCVYPEWPEPVDFTRTKGITPPTCSCTVHFWWLIPQL